MRGAILVLLWVLGGASTAFAQGGYEDDDPEALTAPIPGVAAPPPYVEPGAPVPGPPGAAVAPSDPRRADAEAGSRVLVEALGGAVGYLVGAGAGGLVGCGIGLPLDDDIGCAVGAIFGAVIGAGFGIAGGTDFAGDAMGGQGRFWPAYIGQLLGGLAALGVVLAVASDNGAAPVAIGSMIVLPLAGGTIGYELSHEGAAQPGP